MNITNNLLELVMIVKNSGPILRECLQSIKPYIQEWTIVDTGSIDGTPELIQEELAGISGNLYREPSSDFSTMRNRSLQLSRKNCKYQLVLDDSYKVHGATGLLDFLRDHNDPYYSIKIGKLHQRLLDEAYYSLRIIRSEGTTAQYKGRVHEAIYESALLIDPMICFIDDLESPDQKRRSFNRFKRDVEYLLLDLQDLHSEARTLYYLGRTYYLLEQPKDSIIAYRKLQQLCLQSKQHPEYLFSSMYDRVMIEWTEKLISESEFIKECKQINYLFPERVEPLYKVFLNSYEKRTVEDIPMLLKHISLLLTFKPVQTELTHSDSSIQSYYIPYLFVDMNLQLGNKNEMVMGVLNRMIDIYPRDQPLKNIKYMLYKDNTEYKIKNTSKKVIVFHTGNIFQWDPTESVKNQKVSGSEIMAMGLAQEFSKLGYLSYVVGSFTRPNFMIGKVEYMDIDTFQTFQETWVIDYLISSRFICNLTYRDNIKNVYLWVHDVLPQLNKEALVFQTHPTLFRGIITLGNWHKQHVVDKLGVPENMVLVSRNAIYTERFQNKKIQKIPYRFIYTSCARRGLHHALRIIQRVKAIYPQTTLSIFTNLENVSEEEKKIIDECSSYITLSKRVSQEEIANEMMASDVWLYPTDFLETYCISALEAMCSRCLVISTRIGGIQDTVGTRGVLIKGKISDLGVQDEMVRTICFIMHPERRELKKQITDDAREWALKQNYKTLAQEWSINLK